MCPDNTEVHVLCHSQLVLQEKVHNTVDTQTSTPDAIVIEEIKFLGLAPKKKKEKEKFGGLEILRHLNFHRIEFKKKKKDFDN